MKLISCYIENFGRLHDTEFVFQDGCTVFCKENGWGKSTLAAFLKAMFFGFENEGKRDVLQNERKRFKPWQGGVYGGRVTFEKGGKQYIMRRTFGAKEKEDEFFLQDADSHMESDDFSAQIGIELFQMDAKSFRNSVFVSQNGCEAEKTDQMDAKIGKLEESTDDINNFEKVSEQLKNQLNKMSPRTKTGSLHKWNSKIADLKVEVQTMAQTDAATETVRQRKEEVTDRLAKLREEQKTLQKQQKQVSFLKDIQAKQTAYQALCEEYAKWETQVAEEERFFKGRIPTRDEIKQYVEKSLALSSLKGAAENCRLTKEEEQCLLEIQAMFGGQVPEKTEREKMTAKLEKWQKLQLLLAQNRLTKEEEKEWQQYALSFAAGVPQKEEFQHMISAWNQCTQKKNLLPKKKEALRELELLCKEQKTQTVKKGGVPVMAAVGIILLAAGLGFFFVEWISGIVLSAAGIILMAAGLAGKKRRRRNEEKQQEEQKQVRLRNEEKRQQMQLEIDVEERFVAESEQKTDAFLVRYGAAWQEDRLTSLYELKNAAESYERLCQKKEAENSSPSAGQAVEIEKEIKAFLTRYGHAQYREVLYEDFQQEPQYAEWGERFAEQLHRLERKAEEWETLREKRRQYGRAREEYEKLWQSICRYVEELLFVPGKDLHGQLLEIDGHLGTYEKAGEEFRRAGQQKQQFEKEHADLREAMASTEWGEEVSLEELHDRQMKKQREIEEAQEILRGYEKQLDQLALQRERIEEKEEELLAAETIYEEEKVKYGRIAKTKELLEKAKISFTQKYMEPIMSGFRRYYSLLVRWEAENYEMDANAELKKDEQGMLRDVRFLSTGYRDLLGICKRMALVDAMYPNEKPFLIFDDPFVNLDDEKLQGGLSLLSQIAEEYQVIYFTCHAAREGKESVTS